MTGSLPDPREKPWLTVKELSEITGEGIKTIRRALRDGQLPLLKVGRFDRIPTAALREHLGIAPESTNEDPATGSPLASVHVLGQKTAGGNEHG